jgi:sulfate adenylyltransferase
MLDGDWSSDVCSSDLKALTHKAASLPSMMLSSAAAANAVMLGSGYFNPLTG